MHPSVSTYSFESQEKTSALKVLDIKSGQSTTFFEDAAAFSEPTWISDSEFVLVKKLDKGTGLVVVDATESGSEYVSLLLSFWVKHTFYS